MKIFDSLKTINFYHTIYKNLDNARKVEFEKQVFGLFDKKQVSEEGEYKTFKITKEDITNITDNLS